MSVRRDGPSPPATTLAVGMACGLATSLLLQPLDRLKTLSQQMESRGKSVGSLFIAVVREEGVPQLWRGLTPTIIRVVPGVALHFTIVESLRPKVIGYETRLINPYFLLGFGSRCFVATLLQPASLLKTRLESSGVTGQRSLRELVRRHGLLYFWRGFTPTLLRDAPFSGLYLMFYRYQLSQLEINDAQSAPVVRVFCGMLASALACLLTHPFDALKTAIQLYPTKFSGSLPSSIAVLYKEVGISAFFKGFLLRFTRRILSAALSWTLFDEMISRGRLPADR